MQWGRTNEQEIINNGGSCTVCIVSSQLPCVNTTKPIGARKDRPPNRCPYRTLTALTCAATPLDEPILNCRNVSRFFRPIFFKRTKTRRKPAASKGSRRRKGFLSPTRRRTARRDMNRQSRRKAKRATPSSHATGDCISVDAQAKVHTENVGLQVQKHLRHPRDKPQMNILPRNNDDKSYRPQVRQVCRTKKTTGP